MALHDRERKTFRVEFPGGDWIEMREKITISDRRNATNRATPTTLTNDGVAGAFLVGQWRTAMLYELIVAWSDEEPITEANIDSLPQDVADRLLEELDARNGGRTEKQTAPLESNSTDSSERPLDSGASELTRVGPDPLAISQ